jgi:hypothetical protein
VTLTVVVPSLSVSPDPASPLTTPDTANELVEQLTETVFTLPLPTVPEPPLTEHDCVGPVGPLEIVTA